jgi:hypothetical protein
MTRCCQLLLAIMQQTLQILDSFCARREFSLRNSSLFLQLTILLNKLSLNDGQLFEVALEECHLLLLCTIVARSEDVVVLFPCLIERDLKLNNLECCVSIQENKTERIEDELPSRNDSANPSSSSSS